MNSILEKIYNEIIINNHNRSESIINSYNSNLVYFKNVKSFKNEEELEMYIIISYEYLNAIYNKGRLKETVETANTTELIINAEILKLNATELKKDSYFGIQFIKAMALYYLKEYKLSTSIFKNLIKVDSENQFYKNWYNHSKLGEQKKTLNAINLISIIFCLFGIFSKPWISNYYIKQGLLITGLLGMFATFFYEYQLKKKYKLIKGK